MKTMKSLLAVSILGIAAQTQAFTYYVNGTLDGINTVGATINPSLYLHAAQPVTTRPAINDQRSSACGTSAPSERRA